MKKFEDDRIRFFLKHRTLIEQWSKIQKDIPAGCRRFMWSLQDDVEQMADELEPGLQVYLEKTQCPKIFLYRHGWMEAIDKARPVVGIGVEWAHKGVDFEKSPPYVGIWKYERCAIAKPLREKLAEIAREVTPSNKNRNSNSWWPERTFVKPPNDDYWDDLEPFRRAILDEIEAYWRRYEGHVDGAIEAAIAVEQADLSGTG